MKPEIGHFYRNNSGQIRRVDSICGHKLAYTVISNKKTWPINTKCAGQTETITLESFRGWASMEVDKNGKDLQRPKGRTRPRIDPSNAFIPSLFSFFDEMQNKENDEK